MKASRDLGISWRAGSYTDDPTERKGLLMPGLGNLKSVRRGCVWAQLEGSHREAGTVHIYGHKKQVAWWIR